jgi:integrase/recombinase XerD
MAEEYPGRTVTGPLAAVAAGFAAALASQGYVRGSVVRYIALMAQLSDWLALRELTPADLTELQVQRFVAVVRATRTTLRSARSLVPLLSYLREVGAVGGGGDLAAAPGRGEGGAAGIIVAAYDRFLREERRLAGSTVAEHVRVAAMFLAELNVPGEVEVRDLQGGQVLVAACVLIRQAAGVPAARKRAGSIRSLLRFLAVTGRAGGGLDGVVPGVARHRAAPPRRAPRTLVDALLAACVPGRRSGARDRAVVLLMIRLGLRPGDVAALTLEDLHWRTGQVTVHGKGGRTDDMPLPQEAGAALAGYLRERPPVPGCRAVFLSACAPRRALSANAVSLIVTEACRRAGLDRLTPRLLRQTLASDLVAANAPLSEVAQVLRHQAVATTAKYVAAFPLSFAELIQPWPAADAASGGPQ